MLGRLQKGSADSKVCLFACLLACFIAASESPAGEERSWLLHAILSSGAAPTGEHPTYFENEQEMMHALFVVQEPGLVSPPLEIGKRSWVQLSPDGVTALIAQDTVQKRARFFEVKIPTLERIQGRDWIAPFKRYVSFDSFGQWKSGPSKMTLFRGHILYPTLEREGTVSTEKAIALNTDNGEVNTFLREGGQLGAYFSLGDVALIIFPDGTSHLASSQSGEIVAAPMPEPQKNPAKLQPGTGEFYASIAQSGDHGRFVGVTTFGALNALELSPTEGLVAKQIVQLRGGRDPLLLSWDASSGTAAVSFSDDKKDEHGDFLSSQLLLVNIPEGRILKQLAVDSLSAVQVSGHSLFYAAGNRLLEIRPGEDEGVELARVPARRIIEIFPLLKK